LALCRVAGLFLIICTKIWIIKRIGIKYTKLPLKESKWPQSISNGYKRYQNYSFTGLPKCTKTGGLV
jgi:hypothetical protein